MSAAVRAALNADGNSMAVNVMNLIFERIREVDARTNGNGDTQ
jgi:hypothetical protein